MSRDGLRQRRGLGMALALAALAALVLLAVAAAGLVAAQARSDGTPSALARQGKLVFGNTPKFAAAWTGGKLSCSDCHLKSGTVAYAGALIDVANLFPAFSQRAGHVITLQQRIQECFVRSENGKAPPADSTPMMGLVAYIEYLSFDGKPASDGKLGQPSKGRGLAPIAALKGNPARGKAIYQAQCSYCHDDEATAPPLWGPDSFNDGSGVTRPPVLAAWVLPNMPLDAPGRLTPQQAFDVATYIDRQPRPRFNPANKIY